MRQHNYHSDRNEKQLQQTDILIRDMPYFAKSFFVKLKNSNKASGTVLAYARDLHVFFAYLQTSAGFQDEDIHKCSADILDRLTIDDLEEFISDLSYGPKARSRMISTLRNFYTHYNKRQDIRTNPAALLDKPKLNEEEIIILSRDEIIQILDAVISEDQPGKALTKRREKTKSRDYAILTLLLGTGIRVSELVGLDLQDVDMKTGCIHVIRKGGNEDKVYFGDQVREAIENYWTDDRDALLSDSDQEDALFISYAQRRITVRSVENLVKRYAEKAGLGKKITPHKMRSTFGTHLYEETGDIYLVASALGHSSVETSQKRYARQQEKNKMRAAAASASIFSADE